VIWRAVALAGIVGIMACRPHPAHAMAADGAVITNYASITAYWGSQGVWYTSRHTISYGATIGAVVTNPCATVQKTVAPVIQSAGGTLTYTIHVVSCAVLSTSWNVVVNDPLPDNVAFDASRAEWNGGSGGTITPEWSTNGGLSWTSGSYPAAGQSAPLKLRWVVSQLGPARSAFVSYSVAIQ